MDTPDQSNSSEEKQAWGVPRPEGVYDSGNEPSDEEELRAYQVMYGGRHDERGEAGQSSTQPPPPSAHEEDDPTPTHLIEDHVQDLTMRIDAFWDKTQEHHVSMS